MWVTGIHFISAPSGSGLCESWGLRRREHHCSSVSKLGRLLGSLVNHCTRTPKLLQGAVLSHRAHTYRPACLDPIAPNQRLVDGSSIPIIPYLELCAIGTVPL